MLRANFGLRWYWKHTETPSIAKRSIETSPKWQSLHESSEDKQKAARQWLRSFDSKTIPRSVCEVSFSRSSGPGGQNVNK